MVVKYLKIKITLVILALLLVILIALLPHKVESEVAKTTEDIQTTVLRNHAKDLAKTIALLETSGTMDCSKPGLSGEKGCHQFLPSTWASYSKDVFGVIVEQTPENANKVVEAKIFTWLQEGLTDREIFLIWNQGHPGKCRKGVNKYGVAYNSCAYAEEGLTLLNKVIHTL